MDPRNMEVADGFQVIMSEITKITITSLDDLSRLSEWWLYDGEPSHRESWLLCSNLPNLSSLSIRMDWRWRLREITDIPIWFVHALNDVVVQFQPTAGDLYDRLVEAGHENVELTIFDNVIDTSGQFVDADGNPYEYLGHWSWIYLYNDEVANEEGVNSYEWLNAQAKN